MFLLESMSLSPKVFSDLAHEDPIHQIWSCPSKPPTAQKQHLGSCLGNQAENLCRCHLRVKDVTHQEWACLRKVKINVGNILIFLMAEREINKTIISKLSLMWFLGRCGEAAWKLSLGGLPWEGWALSLVPGWISTPSICATLAGTSEQTTPVVRKSCEGNKQTPALQAAKGQTADRGKIAEKGTVSSSRTRRETHQSCELWNFQVEKESPHKVGAQQQQQ